jgi:hypothetical protein
MLPSARSTTVPLCGGSMISEFGVEPDQPWRSGPNTDQLPASLPARAFFRRYAGNPSPLSIEAAGAPHFETRQPSTFALPDEPATQGRRTERHYRPERVGDADWRQAATDGRQFLSQGGEEAERLGCLGSSRCSRRYGARRCLHVEL